MADPSTWPSASKRLIAVAPQWRQPTGRFTLPDAPHLERFALLQRGALQKAIRRGRERAEQMAGATGIAGSPPFGLNRQHRSTIEARLAFWTRVEVARIQGRAGDYASSTARAAKTTVQPRWADIQRSLQELKGRLAASLYGAFDQHLGTMALAALDGWPVRTGLSRALLHVEVAPGSGSEIMRGSLVAGAGYSGYIQQKDTYRIETSARITIRDGQATSRIRRKRVALDGRLPAWKAAFLVKMADGRWRFDAAAYEAAQAGRVVDPDRKPAKGRPYHDLILTPAPGVAAAIGRDATAGAVKGGG